VALAIATLETLAAPMDLDEIEVVLVAAGVRCEASYG